MVNVHMSKKLTLAGRKKGAGTLPFNSNKNDTGPRYDKNPQTDNRRELDIPFKDRVPICYYNCDPGELFNPRAEIKRATLTIKYNDHAKSQMFYPSPNRIRNALKGESALQKACTLHVSFECGDWTKTLHQQAPFFRMDLPMYWDILLDCIDRLGSITLWAPFVPRWYLSQKGMPTNMKSAPNLRNVTLIGPKGFDVLETAQFLSPLWKSSPLDSFCIKQINENPSNSTAGLLLNYIPTGRLTQLKLDCKLTTIECSLLLKFSPKLEDCSFGDITGAPRHVEINAVCPELESLKLVVDHEDHFEGRETHLWAILDGLTAPKLRRLSVECDDRWQNEPFILFLDRSKCVLEVLEFLLVRIDPAELFEVLTMCRHLRALLYKPDYTQGPTAISSEFLSIIDPQDNPYGLLKDLEILALNEDALGGLRDGQFSQMLGKRLFFDGEHSILRLCWFEVHDVCVAGVARRWDAYKLGQCQSKAFDVWVGDCDDGLAWEDEVETCMAVRRNFTDEDEELGAFTCFHRFRMSMEYEEGEDIISDPVLLSYFNTLQIRDLVQAPEY